MENIQSSKNLGKNLKKLSLRGYYYSLPDRIAPKQKMLEDIQSECERITGKCPTLQTVRNWVLYGLVPRDQRYIEAIVKVTGLAEEDLWKD